jgi:hypothetical protein
LFLGVGQSSGKLGAAAFAVKARLILSPKAGTVGSTVVAEGLGFVSLAANNVLWENPSAFLGTMTANVYGTVAGSAALTFTVPAGAPLGANKVYAEEGPQVFVATTFTVQ